MLCGVVGFAMQMAFMALFCFTVCCDTDSKKLKI